MKKLSILLAFMITLSLCGCGKKEAEVNEVSTNTVVESDSSNNLDEQSQALISESSENEKNESEISESNSTQETDETNDKNDADDKKDTTDANAATDTNDITDTNDTNTANELTDNESPEESLLPEYTITSYDDAKVMYAINSVNIRKGPSTDFERIGELVRGQEITVTGQADTKWYEIQYGEEKAYVSNKYLQNDKPIDDPMLALQKELQSQNVTDAQMEAMLQAAANMQKEAQSQAAASIQKEVQSQTVTSTQKEAPSQTATSMQPENQSKAAADSQPEIQPQPLPEIQPVTEVKNVAGVILVGDSRFVQMQESVGANYCTWIAEGGKGYTWFEEKAVIRIDGCVGDGSKILINLGVNDTRNAQKYLTLINAKAAEWTALGATVYYASVNPVWENPYVTEEQVKNFNNQMQNGLGPYVHWIDSHSYLTSVGYKLVDGLHYSSETYQVIYAYLMSCM